MDGELPDTMVDGAAGLCGNGVIDSDEECDDGNRVDCDGCDKDCALELSGCGEEDGGADTDADMNPPEPPVPAGEPLPVEQEREEAIMDNGWLHLMWTGEYFSFVYERSCPSEFSYNCLSMRRFGKDGRKLGPDWLYTPTEPDESVRKNSIQAFDICWNNIEYGLSWIETEHYPDDELLLNAYFIRLNKDGKVIGTPILLNEDIILFFSGNVPVRIGCSPSNYLIGYPYDVAWDAPLALRYLYLHMLDKAGETTGGAFYGDDETQDYLWPESLMMLDEEWYIVHAVEPPGVDLIVEKIQQDLEVEWRTALLSGQGTAFDWDSDGERGKIAVIFTTESENYLAVIDASGDLDHVTRILEEYPNAVARIASIGNGMYAVLWGICACEGPHPMRVAIVNESGEESEPVEVLTTIDYLYVYPHNMLADIAWTGEEIAVVGLVGDGMTGYLQAYLQLLLH